VLQRVYIIILSLKNSSCPVCGRVHELRKHALWEFCENMVEKSPLKLVIVIWSVIPTFLLSYLFSGLKGAKVLFCRKFKSLKHSVNLKTEKKNIYRSKYMRFTVRTMYNSILFISKLSSLTVGFVVRKGFGVCWRACHRKKRF